MNTGTNYVNARSLVIWDAVAAWSTHGGQHCYAEPINIQEPLPPWVPMKEAICANLGSRYTSSVQRFGGNGQMVAVRLQAFCSVEVSHYALGGLDLGTSVVMTNDYLYVVLAGEQEQLHALLRACEEGREVWVGRARAVVHGSIDHEGEMLRLHTEVSKKAGWTWLDYFIPGTGAGAWTLELWPRLTRARECYWNVCIHSRQECDMVYGATDDATGLVQALESLRCGERSLYEFRNITGGMVRRASYRIAGRTFRKLPDGENMVERLVGLQEQLLAQGVQARITADRLDKDEAHGLVVYPGSAAENHFAPQGLEIGGLCYRTPYGPGSLDYIARLDSAWVLLGDEFHTHELFNPTCQGSHW